MPSGALVAIVEDDESVRESLPDLLKELGYSARAFASAEEFLASSAVSEASCLILDIGLPGMSGPELYRELIGRGRAVPAIFITGHPERSIPPGVENGVTCLFKPFTEPELRAALGLALRKI